MPNNANFTRETPDSLLKGDLAHYENLVQLAHEDFTNSILECTNFLNSTSLKLRNITGRPLQPNTELSHSLNIKLNNSLARNATSVKRSLLTMNNILAQYTVLSIPYVELKCYNQQILQEIKKRECNKLTLNQALNDLQQICRDINSVEDRTLTMVRESVNDKLLFDREYEQCSEGFIDEYKKIVY